MHFAIAAALALAVDATPNVAGTPLQSNLEYEMPAAGSWTYAATADGSEATFASEAGATRMTIRCTRSTRRIALVKAASAASPTMWVWTSSQQKNLPATYDAATGRAERRRGGLRPPARCDRVEPRAHRLQHVGRRGAGRSAVGGCRARDRGLPRLNSREAEKFADSSPHYKSCAKAIKDSSSSRLQRSERR